MLKRRSGTLPGPERSLYSTLPVRMVTGGEVLSLVLVSLLWGCTNPFLRTGSAGLERVREPSRVRQLLAEVRFLLLNVQYMVPFLLNQSGSAVFYYTLSSTDLSVAVPVANSLTFVWTLLTGRLLGEELGGKQAVLGMFLTMAGITLCVVSSTEPLGSDRHA
ncbi:transmembrane protein 234 [Salarias fasciatus]|uniref:Transmembrane protein 234 n=1 Tax=Salarias fasciatus TaxID=181472 RepID=A0A672HFK1_SALFA|nr:transmembrane protein 234 [Salarias fasciatus]